MTKFVGVSVCVPVSSNLSLFKTFASFCQCFVHEQDSDIHMSVTPDTFKTEDEFGEKE